MKVRCLPGILFGLLGFSSLISQAQQGKDSAVPVIDIKGIREVIFENWIAADGVFRIKWPCLKVTLSTSSDIKGDDVIARAYFFDKDQKLLSEVHKIPNANHDDGSYGLPPVLKARERIEVFVPIETKVKEGRWRDVILVFGHEQKLAVEAYPRRETLGWKRFPFAEKEQIVAQQKRDEEARRKRSDLPARPPAGQ